MPRVLRRPLVLVLTCLAVVAALGFVVRGQNAVTRWDARVVEDVAGDRTRAVVDVARSITNLGDGLVLSVLLLVVLVGLRAARVLNVRATIAPLVSLAAGALLAPLVKAIVERPRPPLALHEVVERSSGFPSGHSTQAAAGWLALGRVLALGAGRGGRAGAGPDPHGLLRRWPLVGAAVIVAMVGVSRVVLSVHSPTDVLAGWLLGLVCAVVVVGLLLREPARR
jgi:undecaprenyl-diphosphatase